MDNDDPFDATGGGGPLTLVGDGDAAPGQADYFGFSDTRRYQFPDGISVIEYKIFNEGDRRRYQNATASDVRLTGRGEATVRTAAGDARWQLLKDAIVGWNLVKGGNPVQFTPQMVDQFLKAADPKIIDGLEKAIRRANPWLLSDMTVEDIDKEIESLQELRETVAAQEAGKGA